MTRADILCLNYNKVGSFWEFKGGGCKTYDAQFDCLCWNDPVAKKEMNLVESWLKGYVQLYHLTVKKEYMLSRETDLESPLP
jgi:hypothetical protein